MYKIINSPLMAVLLVLPQQLFAYEPETHEEISEVALEKSILRRDRNFLIEIGVESNEQNFPNANNENSVITDLVRFGSSFEDNGPPIILTVPILGQIPGRVLNHFQDPQNENDRPLTVLGETRGERSSDWILEDGDNEFSDQVYSVQDANLYFYEAIASSEKDIRFENYGMLFQSIGHLMHHMQDMAQPEHVRNDPHVPFLFDRSLYEELTHQRNAEELLTILDRGEALDIAQFQTIRELWNTNGINLGIGIAEYSSSNFISTNTNFFSDMSAGTEVLTNHADYTSPAGVGYTVWSMSENPNAQAIPGTLCDLVPINSGLNKPRVYYQNTVVNQYEVETYNQLGQEVNPFGSSRGIFALDTVGQVSYPLTIDANTVYCANEFLLPQAVTYSATATDYFFRGRFQLESTSESGGTVSVTVKNISLGEYTMDDSLDATRTNEFEIFYDSTDGTRKPVANLTNADLNLVLAGDLPFDSNITLDFDLPADVDYSKSNPYILIFKGVISRTTIPITEEEGIAVLTFTDKPSGGFIVTPSELPIDNVSGARNIIKTKSNQWVATNETGLQAGNIDWKGWYENGKATKVLTWKGPNSRYFPSAGIPFSNLVYENGAPLAAAPNEVLGAALNKMNGVDNIVVIVRGNLNDIVYIRPYTVDLSTDLYNANTNPNGWREIGNSSNLNSGTTHNRAWFFNGEGSEAQTMWRQASSSKLDRIKMSISNNTTVNFTNLGNLAGTTTESNTTNSCNSDSSSTRHSGPNATGDICRESQGEVPIDYVVTNSRQRSYKNEIEETGQYIIAVDYNQHGEVFAKLEFNRFILGYDASDLTPEWQRTLTCSVGFDAQIINWGAATEIINKSYNRSWESDLTLSLDNVNVSLDSRRDNEQYRSNEIRTCDENDISVNFSCTSSYNINRFSDSMIRESEILFVDIRYKIALIQSKTVDSLIEGTLQYAVTRPSQYFVSANTKSTTVTVELITENGLTQIGEDASDEILSNNTSSTFYDFNRFSYMCEPTNKILNSASSNIEFDVAGQYVGSKSFSGSILVDADDNVLMSFDWLASASLIDFPATGSHVSLTNLSDPLQQIFDITAQDASIHPAFLK